MTPTQAQIEAAVMAYYRRQGDTIESRIAAALTAATEVGDKTKTQEAYQAGLDDGRAATIERCAQVARASITKHWGICPVPSALADTVDADLRALKDIKE